MTSIRPLYTDLDFNSPLSNSRAAAIVQMLQPLQGARAIDIGCGWAELLLRLAEAEPTLAAVGVDSDADAIKRGRANAAARGLETRVTLLEADASRWRPEAPADVAMCVGSTHVFGGTAQALEALHDMVTVGGRVLLGEGFWRQPPTEAALSALEGDQLETLAGLVELAVRSGFRPLSISEASLDEWDEFESRYSLGWEQWLLAHPDDPDADRVRARADEHRRRWLAGYRGYLGFAYLVLVRSP